MIKHAIVIDDDELDVRVHSRILKLNEGIEFVESFFYAEEALAHIRSLKPDGKIALFLDINMPRMDGFEFVEELKKAAPELLEHLKIVLLSTSDDHRDVNRVEKEPLIQGLYPKPLSVEVVEELIDDWSR